MDLLQKRNQMNLALKKKPADKERRLWSQKRYNDGYFWWQRTEMLIKD